MAYNTLQGSQIITNGDMTANLLSTIVDIQNMDNIGVQLNFAQESSQFPTGVFQVLGSIDHKEINGNVVVVGTFIPINFYSTPIASGAAGNILINMDGLTFPYIQVAYIATSGKGILNAFISGKAV